MPARERRPGLPTRPALSRAATTERSNTIATQYVPARDLREGDRVVVEGSLSSRPVIDHTFERGAVHYTLGETEHWRQSSLRTGPNTLVRIERRRG